jgi:mono/diheme cytochrome c family protein
VTLNHGLNEVLATVREGRGRMPPISTNELTDDQVAQIVEYLRSLGPRQGQDNGNVR